MVCAYEATWRFFSTFALRSARRFRAFSNSQPLLATSRTQMLYLQHKFSRTVLALLVAFLCASLGTSRARVGGESTPAGTIITNRAEATYEGEAGTKYDTVSETVTFTVVPVATLTVSPKETSPSASVSPQEQVTRVFRICNTGNVANTYTIVDADVTDPAHLANLYFDNDGSGTLTPGDTQITVGSTASASVATGACLGVLAIVDTNNIPFASLLRIHLTARSNATGAANGNVQDDGTIINEVGKGPQFTNPSSAALPPLKEINNLSQAVVSRGNPFTYTVSFRNSGDVSARNVVLTDDLPAGVEYFPGSLHLEFNSVNKDLSDAQDTDEGSAQGNHVELRLAQVAPEQIVRFTFKARLSNGAPAAVGLINAARIAADNAAPTQSTSAVAARVFRCRARASPSSRTWR
jgi:trimeric autotransporter adhesin